MATRVGNCGSDVITISDGVLFSIINGAGGTIVVTEFNDGKITLLNGINKSGESEAGMLDHGFGAET